MITAKNLLKAGFKVGGEEGSYQEYRLWIRYEVSEGVCIVVPERDGKITEASLELSYDSIDLSATTVTELITLAKLLK